ncbi:MAG: hypothetical protein ABIR16_00195 [Dokdonella sp.]
MSNDSTTPYKETVSCEARLDEGVIFIKVVSMPCEGAVEFDVAQARAFAESVLAAVDVVELGWVGKSGTQPAAGSVRNFFKPIR